ncbi:MAG: glycine zipper family protein [Acetobacteraceae bacterium]
MRKFKATAAILGSVLLLSACAQTPMGPTVAVMPAPGKPFDVFMADQAVCKQFAQSQVAGQAENANMRAVGAAALTTALGAGLGAAIGGGRGAGIGAASGALGGTGIGAVTSDRANMSIQQQYDVAYSQCMFSRGNQVPGFIPSPGVRY